MMPARWHGLIALTVLFIGACTVRLSALTLIQDGAATATVVVSPTGSDALREAALTLVDCLKQSSGVELPLSAGSPVSGNRFCIGRIPNADFPYPDQQDLDADGFDITFPDERTVLIVGPSDWGSEFGVYAFLERYVGVRWLMPGEHGTDIPTHRTIEAKGPAIREQPAFMSRLFSGLRGPAQAAWARRNRMHGRVSFHHNLLRLFPPERYTETHPHFFPIQNGERFLPPTDKTHRWQPCFTAEDIVQEAVTNICRYFEANPRTTSYSLGVNDSSGHCQCPDCLERIGGDKNFLGRTDYSDLYYEWCNRVIEGVLEHYPDKVFGCLAYSEVAAPPTQVSVHRKLVPYMTYDRMKWVHPDLRQTGHDMTRAWHRASPTLGWYDYIYGSPYVLPRVWFHHMADYYRFGHANGVRAMYAEAYPNWGEGPKLYVSLKLQWNPSADVDVLLEDWYRRCVGPRAAPHLAAYYRHWETFWTERILEASWFSERGQYLHFNKPSYLEAVDLAEIEQSRDWLEKAVAATETPKQRARAELLLNAFEYYEATAYAYKGGTAGAQRAIQTEAQALDLIAQAARTAHYADRRSKLALEAFATHPVLQHPLDMLRYPLIAGTAWTGGALWATYDIAADGNERVLARIRELARQNGSAGMQAEAMLTLLEKPGTSLLKNSSFETGDGTLADNWTWWVKWQTGHMARTNDVARTGSYSVLCAGMKRGGPVQTLPMSPGRYGLVCFVYVPADQMNAGTVELSLTLREDGRNLPSPSTQITPVPGKWTAVAVAHDVPATIGNATVNQALPILIVGGLEPGDKLYFDDLTLFRLD